MADTKDVALTRGEILEHYHALSLIYDAALDYCEAENVLKDTPIHVVRQIVKQALIMRDSDGWNVNVLLTACGDRLDDKSRLSW